MFRSTARRAFLLSFLVVVALGLACGRTPIDHEYTLTPGQAHHDGWRSALLVPIDGLNDEAMREFDGARGRVESLVAARLTSENVRVERLEVARFRQLTNDAAEAIARRRQEEATDIISTEIRFEDVVPALLEKVGSEADLVIAPSIVMRTGRYNGSSTIVWDGVRRREEQDHDTRMTGTTSVASLHVSVFSKQGDLLFSGFGGLDGVFRPDTRLKRYVLRDDVLEDEDHLREGICVAFNPFFGVEQSCVY